MHLGEYLNNDNLLNLELEAIYNKDKFHSLLKEAEYCIFGKSLDPIIYSNKKSFVDYNDISNIEYNIKGLHLFRYMFSRYAYKHRSRDDILDKGYLILEDFLPEEIHKKIQSEVENFQLSNNKQDFNILYNFKNLDDFSALNYLHCNSNMYDIVSNYISTEEDQEVLKLYNTNTFVQRIVNKNDDNDIQKNIHQDIFFPALKWWYFPNEVKTEHGPFRYQSNNFECSENILTWMHETSIKVSRGEYDDKDIGQKEGSFRATDEELDKMNISVAPIPVKSNTFVLANVQNFHGRTNATEEHLRSSIHGSIRINNPFRVN